MRITSTVALLVATGIYLAPVHEQLHIRHRHRPRAKDPPRRRQTVTPPDQASSRGNQTFIGDLPRFAQA